MVISFKVWVVHCAVTVLFSIGPVCCARNELIATADCVCLGEKFVYECSVGGGSSEFTVWKGSIIDGNCEITLIHSEFSGDGGGPSVDCNNGDVVGQGISALNDCYVSQLSIEVSPRINGSTVECNRDDGLTTTLIEAATIQITTSPAPSLGSVRVSVNDRKLNFTWLPVDYSCPSFFYTFSASQTCGRCIHLANSTTVSCSDFTISTTPRTCEFSVNSVICGNITGEHRSKVVNLQVPGAPAVQTIPQYFSGRTRSLSKLTTTFAHGDSISLTDGIDGSALNFTIIYSDTIFNTICGMINIMASSCMNGVCRHTFNILETSSCPATTSIVTTVYANSVLGRGPSSDSVTRDGINNVVNVTFSRDDQSIVCSFLSQPTSLFKNCSANVTYGENCDQPLGIYDAVRTGNTVKTRPLEIRADVTDYCFIVTATSNNVTVMVEGNINNIGFRFNSAAVAVPVTVVIIILLLTIFGLSISIILYKINHNENSKISEYDVKFDVKDEPKYLAMALNIFKKYGVKVNGLKPTKSGDSNTGLQKVRVACVCSKAAVEKLKNDLESIDARNVKAKLHEHKSGSTRAIEYLVRDQVGANLAGTLEVFSTNGLNITGVNIDHLRDVDKSNILNYVVKVSIDDQMLEILKTKLNRENGVKCIDVERDQFLKITVLDETGSLHKALKEISALGINIDSVNVLDPAFETDIEIVFKHYHMEVVATQVQCDQLSAELYSKGLATDVKVFNVSEYCQILFTHTAPQQFVNDSEDKYTPRTMMIEFFVRMDEVGVLAKALNIFGKLGINVSQINPIHMASHPRNEYIECCCEEENRDALRQKILTCGATKAEFLPENEVPPSVSAGELNYCVVKCSAGSNIMELLKAFQESGPGVKVATINSSHLKPLAQYVECCCDGDKREELLSKLRNIRGVTRAKYLPSSEEHRSKELLHPNYCVVKFSIREEAGILLKALKTFFVLDVNIIDINALKPAFGREETRVYKHVHVVFVGTDEQEKKLKNDLLVSGLALDVKPYELRTLDAEKFHVNTVKESEV